MNEEKTENDTQKHEPEHACSDFDADQPIPFALTSLGERAIDAIQAREAGAL